MNVKHEYPIEERAAFLHAAWAAFALEPYTNRERLAEIEAELGRVLGPRLCSDRGNPALAWAKRT